MHVLDLGLSGFFATAILMTAVWGLSVRKRDVSIVDLFWGPAFVLNAGVGFLRGGTAGLRWLMFSIVSLWGLRLAFHLTRRNAGRPEDRRYAQIRKKYDPGFWWKSLFIIFLFQAALAALIALPIHAVMARGGPIGIVALIGAGLALLGLGIEATADQQLHAFLTSQKSEGQVLDTGLWRYSRHPNYFGDAVVWWGIGIMGLEVDAGYALLGPALMTLLLLKVSGVVLLEQSITERRPAYEDYIRRTSAFIPWPPRSEKRFLDHQRDR